MGFRSDRQLSETIMALYAAVGLGEQKLWSPEGPTPRSRSLLQDDGGPMSSGERLIFLFGWDLWNGRGKVFCRDLIQTLDGGNLMLVGELLAAIGQGTPQAIDSWVQSNVELVTDAGEDLEAAPEGGLSDA